ncbi:hypothetical protein HanXRQr2_Chr09g0394361 [Helianthus annuus]|uniref:Uncharacterized protein n=1 Tax=Helianthus annuus TaxID=4232 RepID=A0A9K3I7T0_HELAN|nr:hypothetical protein HanXRQr2_Chr09g0394361 [Helianthus annuus]KAJ0893653.1 hypothetical protein HanPSC8_Chr09g0380221 [Helianthus annuus]
MTQRQLKLYLPHHLGFTLSRLLHRRSLQAFLHHLMALTLRHLRLMAQSRLMARQLINILVLTRLLLPRPDPNPTRLPFSTRPLEPAPGSDPVKLVRPG